MGKNSQQFRKHKAENTNNAKNRITKQIAEQVDVILQRTNQPVAASILKELESIREILTIVDDIKSAECTHEEHRKHSPVDRTNPENLKTFTDWVKTNGGLFDGLSIHAFDGYELGLKADLDINVESLLIAIPRKLMLSEETALKSPLGNLIKTDKILKGMPNVALAMTLLVEKYTKNSFWSQYINVLPKSYTTVLYYTYEELKELIGSPTLKIALKLIKSICRQYAYFFKVVYLADDPACKLLRGRFSFEEYRWAVTTVMTRQNMIPSEDGSSMISALIPLWDFCNYTSGNITTEYNPMLNRSECLAIRNFKAGEQIFIFYGPRTNTDLFLYSGFVYEDNEHDGYLLNLGISQSDELKEKRIELLQKLHINPTSTFIVSAGQKPIDSKLLAFLRVFNMNEGQLAHWLESDKCEGLECPECALDTCLEKKTWTFLQVRIKLLLAAYKTSLAEDLKTIESNADKNIHRNLAIRLRICEKKILHNVMDYVEQYIKQYQTVAPK